jgi:hypothetical protein
MMLLLMCGQAHERSGASVWKAAVIEHGGRHTPAWTHPCRRAAYHKLWQGVGAPSSSHVNTV